MTDRTPATPGRAATQSAAGTSAKGLTTGRVGLLGAVVIGISCIAPAYTLTSGLGPTIAEVGQYVPAILLLGFIPMLLVAFGYRELNNRVPDSGTSFTWATKAFGPYVGWMGGWGLIAATVIVLSNLAAVAVDFFYLLLAQITGNASLAELTTNLWVNIPTTLVFIAVAAYISYRGLESTQKVQYVLVGFQLLVLGGFAVAALVQAYSGGGFDVTPIQPSWFNPLEISDFSILAAGISLSIFMFWGWDVTLTMNEETKDPEKTPGRAATITVLVIIAVYVLSALAIIAWAGVGADGLGAGNPDNQESLFAVLAGPVMGPFALLMSIAILSSSFASLQSTMVSPARTLLAMGYYRALPPVFAKISPRFKSPGVATIASALAAAGFYTITRLLSENALWDTITALGLMICFYYGVTALACVWYFRRELFVSVRTTLFRFLFPLIGGLVLMVMFFITAFDSMDPDYGSGSSIGGLGMVFVLGMGVLVLGVVLMVWTRLRHPGFFLGETLRREDSVSDDTSSMLTV
ncbi:APC family permease [Micrococcus terreus]|uniref:Amino acid/polyamine/organocation transporter, APC superfamily (TC 2.A.3) n=1 Tax=Micrococcus terreus TaxID=574650 RepID=A0A1I7MS19_9MICC|nr:APC family permease [Micrococcus terreus]SFV24720.1 amino acid/polyamine/organocation transporter, APC superfamily (TC 2.A.3) [Micrococcus terreus]